MSMNYSRYHISCLQKQLKSNSVRLRSFGRITVYRILLIALTVCIIVGCYGAYGAYLGILRTSPSIDGIDKQVTPYKFSSVILAADGSELAVLKASGTDSKYASIDDIPVDVQNCFVAMEDERYWEHSGIDIRGIFRAGVSVLKDGGLDYGASTITQQLLKNQVFSGGNEKTVIDKVIRKLQEQYLAVKLEDKLSKGKILEYYLNTINLGNGSYGIAAAAQNYFGKEVSELTISEAAVLAPIAYSPTYMNPINYQEDNARRRLDCLNNLYENGFCTKAQYDEAILDSEDVYLRIAEQQTETKAVQSSKYSYFVDEVIEQVISDLEDMGYTTYEANYLLYNGGLTINTTMDTEIQAIMDKYFTDESNFPEVGSGSYYELTEDYAFSIVGSGEDAPQKHYHLSDLLKYYESWSDSGKLYYHEEGSKGISVYTLDKDDLLQKIDAFEAAMTEKFEEDNPEVSYTVWQTNSTDRDKLFTLQPQCAMVIMDQETGCVLAQYGGRGEKTGNRVLNRASQTYRQAGSTFKVLASFLPALDSCGYTLASTFDDSYYEYPDQIVTDPDEIKTVTNWYKTGYQGLQSIRKGIYYSMNIVAVRCMEAVTPATAMNYLKKLGFSKLDTDASDGVSDYNVSLALGGLTNGVSVLEMTAGYAAIANEGVYNEPRYYTSITNHDGSTLINNKQKSTPVMKSSTAYLLTSAMVDTTTIGTGTKSRFTELSIPVAGKTGTAHDNYDLWFAGFTPYYTAAIWSGFDNNFTQTDSSYYRYLWRNVMEEVHKVKNCPEDVDFVQPASIEEAVICTKCGKLAVAGLCDSYSGGNCTATEIFAKGTAPYQKCTCHVKVSICTESGKTACSGCTSVTTRILLDKIEDPDIISHGVTQDTAYCYTAAMRETCPLHSGAAAAGDSDSDSDSDDD